MRNYGRIVFPALLLVLAVFVWGCQSDHHNRSEVARDGSTLLGGDDANGAGGGDHQEHMGFCPDSMGHSDGEMGGMHGDSSGMGGMHGGDCDMGGMHGDSSGMGGMHGGGGGMGGMHGDSSGMGGMHGGHH